MEERFKILPGEELHHLLQDELFILQRKDQFRFGIDAVLLANWVRVRSNDKVVDLGTGSGVIPLLIAYKKNPKQILGVEIQKEMAELAARSVALNQLEGQIEIAHLDLRRIRERYLPNRFTLVVSNPPYFPVQIGEQSPNDAKAIARHELLCTLDDLIGGAAHLLGTKGRLAMIHRAERIPEIFRKLTNYGMEAKVIRLIQPRVDREANLVLIEAVNGAKPGLKIEPNLIIYDLNGNYTSEVQAMYLGKG